MNKTRGVLALALALSGAGERAYGVDTPEVKGPDAPVRHYPPGLTPPVKDVPKGYGGPVNLNEDGPSCPGGPVYRKVLDPDSKVWGWRSYALALYYRDKNGEIHAYQPGQDLNRDKAFPAIARKQGLRLLDRAARRKLHREERARYKAIQARRSEVGT